MALRESVRRRDELLKELQGKMTKLPAKKKAKPKAVKPKVTVEAKSAFEPKAPSTDYVPAHIRARRAAAAKKNK